MFRRDGGDEKYPGLKYFPREVPRPAHEAPIAGSDQKRLAAHDSRFPESAGDAKREDPIDKVASPRKAARS